MRLMSKNRKVITYEVTPEMRKRIRELNEQAMKDQIALRKYYEAAGDMQAESLAAANRLDNQARYGTSNFVSEGRTYTKKMRFKK